MKKIFLIVVILFISFSLSAHRSKMRFLSRTSVIYANENAPTFEEWRRTRYRRHSMFLKCWRNYERENEK